MARKHRVVDHIVDYLAAIGVDYHLRCRRCQHRRSSTTQRIFRDDITAVLAKHEFSAATMADGYSRSGARPGRRHGHLGRRLR